MKTIKVILHVDKATVKVNILLDTNITAYDLVNAITNTIALTDSDEVDIDDIVNFLIVVLHQEIDYNVSYKKVRALKDILNRVVDEVIIRFLENKILVMKKGVGINIYRNPLIDYDSFYLYKKKGDVYIFKYNLLDTQLLPYKR